MHEEPGMGTPADERTVAHASVVSGERRLGRLTIWPAGHFQGDLGDPRLNQRAALYAEAILDKGLAKAPPSLRKVFDGANGKVEVEFEFPATAGVS
jgi:hypothetical protein